MDGIPKESVPKESESERFRSPFFCCSSQTAFSSLQEQFGTWVTSRAFRALLLIVLHCLPLHSPGGCQGGCRGVQGGVQGGARERCTNSFLAAAEKGRACVFHIQKKKCLGAMP